MYKYLGVGYLHGVPRRDLSEQEWRALSDGQRSALKPYYVRINKRQAEQQAEAELESVLDSGDDPLIADKIEVVSPDDKSSKENTSWQ